VLSNLRDIRNLTSTSSFPTFFQQAAVGWPISEIFDRSIADGLGMPALLAEGGRAASILNGGMESVSPVWWGSCLGLTAAIDLYGIAKSRSGDPEYFPGNLGFDPLGFYPTDAQGRKRMELAEIKHGRTAMMAVAGYAAQEYVTKFALVEETPYLFSY
jgi:Chlorophyll A-B binding protein